MSFLGSSLPLVKSSSNHIFRDGISGFSFPIDGKSVSIPSSRALNASSHVLAASSQALAKIVIKPSLLLSQSSSNHKFRDGISGFSFIIDGKSVNIPSSRGGGSSPTIYFDPSTEQETGEVFKISPDQLWATMLHCAEVDGESLGNVAEYKVPLASSQKSSIEGSVFMDIFDAFHMFVTIRIGRAWWSFERYAECILVQRSVQKDAVIKKSMKKDRAKCSLVQIHCTCLGVSSKLHRVNDLVSVLKAEFEAIISGPFHALRNNCQHFARKILRQMGKDENEEARLILCEFE